MRRTLHSPASGLNPDAQVIVYDAQSCSVRRTFSRFKDKAYSGSFRGDGRLLVAGGEEGVVQARPFGGGRVGAGERGPGGPAAGSALREPGLILLAARGVALWRGGRAGPASKCIAWRSASNAAYMGARHAQCAQAELLVRLRSKAAAPKAVPPTPCWQVFDASSRGLLRQFKGHQRPVHVARFAPDKLHVLSGGDDALARWWDVSSGKQVGGLGG